MEHEKVIRLREATLQLASPGGEKHLLDTNYVYDMALVAKAELRRGCRKPQTLL